MRSGSKVSGKELLQSPERHGPARPDRGRAGRRVTKLLCNDGKQNPDNSCTNASARCWRSFGSLKRHMSPDHSSRRAAPPPLFHLRSRRLRPNLSDDPAEPTLPHPALLLSAAARPAVAIPVAAQPAVAVPIPQPSQPSPPHPTPTPTTPMTPSSSPIVYLHLSTRFYRRHTPALIS